MRRFVLLGAGVALSVSACGGGEVSLSEYAEELTTLMEEAIEQGEELTASGTGAVLVAEGAQLDEFTPKDLQAALERVKAMEQRIRAGADAIEPPEALADLHRLMFDTRFAMALEPLAARSGTAATWEELSQTPEMAAYREAVTVDKQACLDIQAELDATAERGIFSDNPWLPDELKEVIDVLLGCATFPENPQNLYRPTSASTP